MGKKKKAELVGVGLDNKDGHTRLTKGDDFTVVGGSKETHEKLQEHAIKFNEELSKRSKDISSISKEEFYDIADKIGLK